MEQLDPPYRVVDADNHGWYLTGDILYHRGYGDPGLSYPQLDAEHGPLRPVLPITDEDDKLMRAAFAQAGRRTVPTLCAALDEVFYTVRESAGGLHEQLDKRHESYEYAERTLKAGRSGSWEAVLLMELVHFGNGLNLVKIKGKRYASVEEMRAAGPSKRVDVDARRELAEILLRWVTGPGRYTEVAETLAFVVSDYADGTAGPDGWKVVADQWLQPGGLATEDFRTCYKLLYSRSEHLNTAHL